ncbi:TRAP-type C4-dicarboxylate transport system%2C large permease component [Vibrio cholerae]|nr:TRAP-type C4-dicarboxylate transport system%2C large permease component [Vibrio cholerae]
MAVALLFILVIGMMIVGVPIAISLGLSSILFLLWHSDASLASVAQTLFNAFAGHYTLLAIPFFILASTFMSTDRQYRDCGHGQKRLQQRVCGGGDL